MFQALRTCAEMGVDASQMWATAKDLFVLVQDSLEPLQASPAMIVENLENYATLLAGLTGIPATPATTDRGTIRVGRPGGREAGWTKGVGGGGGYVVTHLTVKVLGSKRGDSGGVCFRGGLGAGGEEEAVYEAGLGQFNVLVLKLLRHMIYWALQFEPGKDIDSAHVLSQYALPGISQVYYQE
jgi:hypothetical protein